MSGAGWSSTTTATFFMAARKRSGMSCRASSTSRVNRSRVINHYVAGLSPRDLYLGPLALGVLAATCHGPRDSARLGPSARGVVAPTCHGRRGSARVAPLALGVLAATCHGRHDSARLGPSARGVVAPTCHGRRG